MDRMKQEFMHVLKAQQEESSHLAGELIRLKQLAIDLTKTEKRTHDETVVREIKRAYDEIDDLKQQVKKSPR
jgi:hypothetical protein